MSTTTVDRERPPIAGPSRPTRSWWSTRPRLMQVVTLIALALGVAYLTWRFGWTATGANLPLFIALIAAEVFGWASLAFYAFLAWSVPTTERPAPLLGVTIDVFVCTYDEPVSVVETTLVGCRAIEAPHVTYLLDDGRRPEMAELAAHLGARYVVRSDNSHAKAGNINHALDVTDGELILMLDADHVPLPDILDAISGYFIDDDVALVQTPHDFSNRDSVQHTKLDRHEQTLFYEVIAPGKDRHNAMFWCGSATLVRRRALLDVHGVLTDTVAEDFHTTIAMHAKGWRTRYHDETLVQGLAPHDLAAFLLQRARWARGNLAVFRTKQNPITCPGLTAKQRVSYLASLCNYFSGLQRMTLLVVLVVTLTTGALPFRASIWALVLLWLPWSVMAFTSTLALGRGTLGPLDSSRYGLLTMGINLRATVALVTRRAGAFKVTPKAGVDEGGLTVLRTLGLLTGLGVALAVAWVLRVLDVAGVVAMPALPSFATAVVVALGVWELFCIANAVVPLVRRHQVRARFRTPVSLRARVAGSTVRVQVHDVSPVGIGFESPVEYGPGEHLEVVIGIPDARGRPSDLTVPVEVRSCAPAGEGSTHRVGGRVGQVDGETHDRLVEFCDVVLPMQRFGRPWSVGREPAARRVTA